MDLIIVQQGAGLHFELQHRFTDTHLTHADRHAWAQLFDYIYTTHHLRILLPVAHLQREACYKMRNNIAGLFVNGRWEDKQKIKSEVFDKLGSISWSYCLTCPIIQKVKLPGYLRTGMKPLRLNRTSRKYIMIRAIGVSLPYWSCCDCTTYSPFPIPGS